MLPLQDNLLKWADELENYKTPGWNALPDIDLYMDQVITWLERQMSVLSAPEDEKLITPSMINNYVKNEVIPRPIQKKYTREHLVNLIAVMNLKQVLPLSDIARLISQVSAGKPIRNLFDQFQAMQDEALYQTSVRVKDSLEKLDGDLVEEEAEMRLSALAIKFSLEANLYRIAAKKIVNEIAADKEKCRESKDKGKDKERDKVKDKAKGKSGKD